MLDGHVKLLYENGILAGNFDQLTIDIWKHFVFTRRRHVQAYTYLKFRSRSSRLQMFFKVSLKLLKISQENICVEVLF